MSLPDYSDLYDAHEKAKEDKLDKYPVCKHCKDPITDEKLYIIEEDFVCEECLKDYYRFDTDDYVRE